MATTKRIAIVGAGPGGVTAAMILARRGFKVTVFERKPYVGGRNSNVQLGDFNFDLGPTFLMLKNICDEMFVEAGTESGRHLDFRRLEPMYRLQFEDRRLEITTDRDQMKAQIAEHFPGHEHQLDPFLAREQSRFFHLFPCLQKPYSSFGSLFCKDLMKAVPHLALGKSLYNLLYSRFQEPKLALSFTFQSKYLGMSPWECPGLFAILSYIEHAYGVYHTIGGICKISDAMADVARANGADIQLETPVQQLLLKDRQAAGVVLEDGTVVEADEVIINADFAHAMCTLFPDDYLRHWTPAKLEKKRFSCSTFMLYLGLDKLYDMPHHCIVFAKDYRGNVDDIFARKVLSDDISFYVRNASVTDPTLAPEGKSAVYILVPVPNRRADVDWQKEAPRFRKLVLQTLAERTAMTDIEDHIEQEKIIVPDEWTSDYGVYTGATFNLAHNVGQMLYLRPHNRFNEASHCYLVGGGTHPGSGLPTIFESGRIAADLISDYYGVQYQSAKRMP